MQKEVKNYLIKNFRKAKVSEEFPLSHGTMDLLMTWNNKWFAFELKTKPCEKVFEQVNKHTILVDYKIVICSKPANQSVASKWEKNGSNNNVKVLWIEKLDSMSRRRFLKELIFNDGVSRTIRRALYNEDGKRLR